MGNESTQAAASAGLSAGMTPSRIVHFLDQYVVGQTEAKKILAVAVYAHYRKSQRQLMDVATTKSNVLLIGPTMSATVST